MTRAEIDALVMEAFKRLRASERLPDGFAADGWNEAAHPRDRKGQFTAGKKEQEEYRHG